MRQVIIGVVLGVVGVVGCGQAGDTATAGDGLHWFEVIVPCGEVVYLESEPRLIVVEEVSGFTSPADYDAQDTDDGYAVNAQCNGELRVRGLE